MRSVFQLQPMALAVSGALGLMAAVGHAQTFDPNSAAVRQAYLGAATQEKKDAALAGLEQLAKAARFNSSTGTNGFGGGDFTGNVTFTQNSNPSPQLFRFDSTIEASKDGDLGAAGAPVTLNNTILYTLASFSTSRDFFVSPRAATIDTNGFNFSISGNINASGILTKSGLGTLVLTGTNTWAQGLRVTGGVLEGNASSLQASIANAGTVRFNQLVDGTFSGTVNRGDTSGLAVIASWVGIPPGETGTPITITGTAGNLEKTGPGKLIITSGQSYGGTTAILGGTLALKDLGTLGDTSAINIASGASLDISGSQVMTHNAGTLSGAGNIVLGSNFVQAGAWTDTSTDSTFSGVISGSGGLVKNGPSTLTLTGANSYAGTTTVASGTLALAESGRLNPLTSLSVFGGTFDISTANGDREVGSISGGGDINLGANTLITGGNNTSTYFAGTISGRGGLTKTGTGDLDLWGANTYTGVTTILQGNLIARTQSISDRVVNNATLTLTEDKSVTTPLISAYSGNISGTGQLVKAGDGIIWLRGRNSYGGGTQVNDGVLIGNTDSLQGNITNNATLAFYQVDNGTYSGKLSGSGALLHFGPGVLTLSGNNTYTGGTATSGTIRIDRDANLGAANGPLVLAGGTLKIGADIVTTREIHVSRDGGTIDTNGYTLSTDVPGGIWGFGNLTKAGAGTLTLNALNLKRLDDSSFVLLPTPNITVSAGRLNTVGNFQESSISVAAGAELGVTGVIGHLNNSGRLLRSGNIGVISVEGTATFESGSVFTVKTDAGGNSDRLQILKTRLDPSEGGPMFYHGNAVLKGGTVDVRAESGTYNRQTRYNIINAAGGVSGQFQGVTSNFAFLNPSLAYDANNVYLTLTRNDIDYAVVAQTANQSAIARGLTRMTGVTSGDAATVTTVLDSLSAPQARAAFDSIGAAGRGALPQVGTLNQRSVNQNLVARLGIAEGGNTLAPVAGIGGRALQLAFDESARSDAAPVYAQAGMPAGGQGLRTAADPNNGFWLRGYGGTGRIDGDASAPGAKYNYGGTLFGYDRKISNAVTLGVFGGYAEPRYSQDVATSSARAKTYQVGGYGRLLSGPWHMDATASYARNDTDTSRVVTVGALNRTANGSFTGGTVSAHVETGYTLKAGAYELQPLAALSWVRQTQNAYSETGAGTLNLVLPDQSQASLRSSLGLRTLRPFQAGAVQAVVEARAAWSHEFNNTRSINARLAGDPAAAVFTVSGPSLPRDSAVVGVGVAAQAARNLRVYADLNGEFNGRVRAGALSVGLRYQW